MLEIENLRAGYASNNVIPSLDLSIGERETVAVLGPNGAGKSTLIGAIAGVGPERSGKIIWDGHDLARMQPHSIVSCGVRVVPEGRRIFAPLSVLDNLQLGGMRLPRKQRTAAQLAYVFELFPRLRERISQIAGTLSGGEQQMLAIGRALMSAPRLLLLDEPFLGLAPMVVDEISRAINALQTAGLAVLLVEQKIELALAMGARAYLMVKGQVVLEGTAAALRERSDLSEFYLTKAA